LFIPANVFGPGSSIAYCGSIVVEEEAKVDANCRIHQCFAIGTILVDRHGISLSSIGENVFIGQQQ
jgi:serine O-acetyltransferase